MRIKNITVCRITPAKSTPFDNAVSDAAEDIADRDFHLPFNELPNHLQMKVWQDAEAVVRAKQPPFTGIPQPAGTVWTGINWTGE